MFAKSSESDQFRIMKDESFEIKNSDSVGVYKSRKNNYYLRMFSGGGSCNLVRYSNTYVKGYNGLKIEVVYDMLFVYSCKSINFSTSNPEFRLIKVSQLTWTL